MSNILFVQSIKSVWTKNSRGGRLASLRSAVPDALPVPLQDVPASGLFIFHTIVFDESNEFSRPLTDSVGVVGGDFLETGCVRVELRDSSILVRYEYNARCGAPSRSAWGGVPAVRSFELHQNETGRVVYNGRFSGDNWWYEQRVLNVGLSEKLAPHLFTSSKPLHLIDDTAILW